MRDSEPSCTHFGTCGGCSALTTPLTTQREARIGRVRRELAEFLGDLEIGWTDAADAPVTTRHDRTRILYPVQPTGDARRMTMGLYRAGTHEPIEIEACATQDPALTELQRRALHVLRATRLAPYDERSHRGTLRAFGARLMPGTGELLAGIVTTSPDLQDAAGLATALRDAAAGIEASGAPPCRLVGIVHNVNPHRGNALLGDSTRALWGRAAQEDRVGALSLRVGFTSFYQLHRDSDALLYRPALEMIGPVEGLHVVDAFGGVGCFALRLAARGAAMVTLVEAHAGACDDARHNAEANSLSVDVVEAGFDRAPLPRRTDLLLVDPSRAGLRESGCARVAALAPPRILYVACGLPALARDLRRLGGYRITGVRVADLFPHTDHVETLVLLERRS